jgi:phosphoenolpyruvate synthase/pyruvate phosphate dikinase
MNLAAPEMVRVAKEANTYQYELRLRKEQDEGDLNKELAALHETLSAIQAEIATYQAQIDTAREKEMHRANAYARQLLSEAESAAKANAALLEAQALDIRAVSGSLYPEILQYRFQQQVLDTLAGVADHLPHVVQIGATADEEIDLLALARTMLGMRDEDLFSDVDLQALRDRLQEIQGRIREREGALQQLIADARIQKAMDGGVA